MSQRVCADEDCDVDLTGRRVDALYCQDSHRRRQSRRHRRDHELKLARERYARRRVAEGHPAPVPQPRVSAEESVSWDFPDGLIEQARRAAAATAKRYKDVAAVDFDTSYQEALLWSAVRPARIAAYMANPDHGLGYVYLGMKRHLSRLAVREADRQRRMTSFEALVELGWHPEQQDPGQHAL